MPVHLRRPDAPSKRTEPRARIEMLDGLRGLAIVLVVLSHGWVIWPTDFIDNNELTRSLFRNGNFAVTIFLFAAGFFTYRALVGRTGERNRIGTGFVRRVLRVAPITLVVLPVIVLVGVFDDSDTTSSETNGISIWYIVTYRWNWFLQTRLPEARWDLGHLWYLSVDMQAFVLMAFVIYLLRRQPWGLVLTLTGMFALFTWWRMHVAELEDPLLVLLRTTARIDAFIAGVLLGAVLALMTNVRIERRHLTIASSVALASIVGLAWYCSRDARYLHWGVTLLEVALFVAVGAAVLGARQPRLLSTPALTLLGRNSLPLYVWHYPVFAAVQRNTLDWAWGWRAALAISLTVALSVASHYLVERRVSRLLAHPFWKAGDRSRDADRESVA